MTTYLLALRRFNRDVLLFLVTAAVMGFTVLGGISTVLTNLYLLRLGYGPDFIGLVNAFGELGFAVFAFPAMALSTRLDSRRMLIVGMVIATAMSLLFPLAEFVPTAIRSAWILAALLASSLGFALYFVGANPFLMLHTSDEERNHAFAIQSALWPLAGFAGSVAGGLLPRYFGNVLQVPLTEAAPYRYPLLISAALLAPAAIALFLTRPVGVQATEEPEVRREDGHSGSPRALVIMIAVVIGLMVAGEGVARFFFNVYLDDGLGVPTEQIGLLSGVAQLIAVPAALVTPILATRWRNSRITLLAALGVAVSLLPMAFLPHPAAVGFSFMAVIAMSSMRRPASLVYAMEMVPRSWHARMSGGNTAAVGLSWFIVALLGGYIITYFGYTALFLFGAGLTTLGALVFLFYFRPGTAPVVVPDEQQAVAADL